MYYILDREVGQRRKDLLYGFLVWRANGQILVSLLPPFLIRSWTQHIILS